MKKYLYRLLSLCLLAAVFLALIFSDVLYEADMLIQDKLYEDLESQRQDIRIIAIDEKTEAAYGKFENWSREKSAELTELLSADPEKAPALLVFDIMFMGNGDADTDARLADAAEKAGNVICASNLIYTGRMEGKGKGNLVYNPAAIDREERPYDALAAVTRVGFANACISKDNVIRYAQLFAEADGEQYQSLSYTVYQAYAEKTGMDVNLPRTRNGQVGFSYSGNPGDIPHVSLVDVLQGNIPLTEFEDCLVMVGAYAPGFQDMYNTPVARGEQMYGVEINANIILALMEGKLATPAPTGLYVLLSGVVLLLWAALSQIQKPWIVTAEAVALIGLHLVSGRVLAQGGILIPQIYFLLAVVLRVIWFIVETYVAERAKRRYAIGTLKKYVAPQIVEKLSKNGTFELRLGGEKKHIAVLFVDIRGFTTMSESLPPEEVVRVLNQYLSVTTRAVFQNEGTLDKFVGDATMAVFNAPFDLEDYIFKAVQTGWDIQKGVAALVQTMAQPIYVGVGINCGEAVVGNIGSEARMDYTAIGDTVNTAARLESSAKAGQVLISQAVYDRIAHRVTVQPMGELTLKGKQEKVPVYNVTGFCGEKQEAITNG